MNRRIFFSGAGRPLVVIQNGSLQKINGNIRSTGGFQPAGAKPFEDIKIDLITPTYIYLFSDGYSDQISSDKKKFGHQRFFDLLMQPYSKPMAQQGNLLSQMMENHLHGADQLDDICVLGIRVD